VTTSSRSAKGAAFALVRAVVRCVEVGILVAVGLIGLCLVPVYVTGRVRRWWSHACKHSLRKAL
jgi:hypothetical protein